MHSSSYQRSFIFTQGNSFPFTLPLSLNCLSLLGINVQTDLCNRSLLVRVLFVQWVGQVGVVVRRFRVYIPSYGSIASGTRTLPFCSFVSVFLVVSAFLACLFILVFSRIPRIWYPTEFV